MSKRGHAPRWWEAKSKPGSDDEGDTVQTVASDEELEAETPEEHGDTDLPRPTDIFIACMGVTGSGKSSFVSMCCGKQVKIGHDLNSCTSVVQIHSFKLSPNQTVYLIDTPGFDDTDISDTEVLRAIAHWLNESYKKKVLLRGILYFHRITDVRMTGSAKKNILMFKKLCGNNALQNVALVTSMWDQVLKEDGGRREKQLIETPQYWGYMVSKGSITLRHDNTVASALAIVRHLADGEGDPVKLDVQDEMIDRQKLLDQTEAWQELEAARIEEHKKWETKQRENEKQLEKQLREEMRQALRAKDEQSLKELREMKEELKEDDTSPAARRGDGDVVADPGQRGDADASDADADDVVNDANDPVNAARVDQAMGNDLGPEQGVFGFPFVTGKGSKWGVVAFLSYDKQHRSIPVGLGSGHTVLIAPTARRPATTTTSSTVFPQPDSASNSSQRSVSDLAQPSASELSSPALLGPSLWSFWAPAGAPATP
ncbi:hypothetical protein SGCOL_004590 [Colletotrichum sp. CLE4]